MVIQLQIENESQLYSSFDPAREHLDAMVYDYLKSYCAQMRKEKVKKATIRILTEAPIDADHFKEALQKAVLKDREEFSTQIAQNNKRAIWSCIMGVLLSAVGAALAVVRDQILLALISLVGTMGINDAITIWARVNPDIKMLQTLLDPLLDFDLEISKPEI